MEPQGQGTTGSNAGAAANAGVAAGPGAQQGSQVSGSQQTGAGAPGQPGLPAGFQVPDGYMVVQREAFAPWGYDWSKALTRAKTLDDFEREMDASLEELVDLGILTKSQAANVQAQGQQGAQPQGAPGRGESGPQGDDVPLTVGQFRKLQDESRKAQEAEWQKSQETQRLESKRSQAWTARSTAEAAAMKDIGFGPDAQGKPSAHAKVLHVLYQTVLDDAMRADIPSFHHGDEKWEGQYLDQTAPSEAQAARALEAVKAFIADQRNVAVSQAATAQATMPGATLNAGAGGRPGVENFDKLSAADQARHVAEAIERNRPR